MRLAILSVQSNKHYEAAHGIKTPINFQSHHISQIFLHFLHQFITYIVMIIYIVINEIIMKFEEQRRLYLY